MFSVALEDLRGFTRDYTILVIYFIFFKYAKITLHGIEQRFDANMNIELFLKNTLTL